MRKRLVRFFRRKMVVLPWAAARASIYTGEKLIFSAPLQTIKKHHDTKEETTMTRSKLYTGLITGAIMGGAVSMMMSGNSNKQKAKTMKRNVGKTIKSVGEIVDSFM